MSTNDDKLRLTSLFASTSAFVGAPITRIPAQAAPVMGKAVLAHTQQLAHLIEDALSALFDANVDLAISALEEMLELVND